MEGRLNSRYLEIYINQIINYFYEMERCLTIFQCRVMWKGNAWGVPGGEGATV
jgi:hypothetical protein